MNAKRSGLIVALLILNLILTAGLIIHWSPWAVEAPGASPLGEKFQASDQYVLYIGTNDQHSYRPVMPLAEARATVDAICLKHAAGFTVIEGQGVWTDETKRPTHEETLIYIFMDIDEERLTSIMDETLAALNQNSILVEKSRPAHLYYQAAK